MKIVFMLDRIHVAFAFLMNLSLCLSQRCSCEIETARYSMLSKRLSILPKIVYLRIFAMHLISINIIAHIQLLMSSNQVVRHAVLLSVSSWMMLYSSKNWYMCTQICRQHIDSFYILLSWLCYLFNVKRRFIYDRVLSNTTYYVVLIGMWSIK